MATKTLLLLTGAIAMSGCSTGPKTVGSLPSPSFAAPIVLAPEPAPRSAPAAPVVVRPPTATPSKRVPTAISGGPRDWAPPVPARAWKYVVVHHSATAGGGAAAFDRMHKAKGWDGLGYDFVIGNGTDTADGQVEVGFRWKQQITGAHARTPDNRYNEYGIGICLVGNFDVDRPTAAQMQSLSKLVAYLTRTYRITPDNVIGHRDTKSTECPGKFMNVEIVRRSVGQNVATDRNTTGKPDNYATATELLTPLAKP
ncbi:MAG TPA: peptidoglycan recognition family protein [Tepidisphaeraceae bacterium]|nr:peptidoglycan recognition family protein [Tepidisphaeraceae bacterium]